MKITVVMGFFLPMPPVAGGAVEKSWHSLARELVSRGHEVTLISRSWQDWPDHEKISGVTYLRMKGYNHSSRLIINLLLDLIWCVRVHRHLPKADVIVVNTISLACWLGTLRRQAGKVVLMLGRMPKGQFRLYRNLARIFVPSTPVRQAVELEAPRFSPIIRTIGYPINWRGLASGDQTTRNHTVTLGFIGRINREKGLDLLMQALQGLAKRPLPPWRMILCGPEDIARGGSGPEYLAALRRASPEQVEFLQPVFDERSLHAVYQQIDVFCYPSLAAQGETFGVAVAEAMAAGAVPVVSNLSCFLDFVEDGKTGLVFNPGAVGAADKFAELLESLIVDETRRNALSAAARQTVECYDAGNFAEMIECEFAQLTPSGDLTSCLK